jgi:hypothetical protein
MYPGPASGGGGCSSYTVFHNSSLLLLHLAQLWLTLPSLHPWLPSWLCHRCMPLSSSRSRLCPGCPTMARGTNSRWPTPSTRWRFRRHPHFRSGSPTLLCRTTPHPILLTSLFLPPNPDVPSSIVVGNGFVLPITSVGDTLLPGLFYVNNVLVAPDIIKNLVFVHQFTTDN